MADLPPQDRRQLRIVEIVLVAVMAGGLYFLYFGAPGNTRLGPAVNPATLISGQLVPSYQLTELGGKSITSETFAGKVAVLHFWGTRCGPCIQEMPDVNALYTDSLAADERVAFVSFASDQDRSAVERFVRGRGVPFPVVANTNDEAYRVWTSLDVSGTPTTILVDPEGRVRWRGSKVPRNLNALIDAIAPQS